MRQLGVIAVFFLMCTGQSFAAVMTTEAVHCSTSTSPAISFTLFSDTETEGYPDLLKSGVSALLLDEGNLRIIPFINKRTTRSGILKAELDVEKNSALISFVANPLEMIPAINVIINVEEATSDHPVITGKLKIGAGEFKLNCNFP